MTPAAEIRTLREHYETTDGDNWVDNTGWGEWNWSSDPCTDGDSGWHGVECEEFEDGTASVVELDLSSNNLSGPLAVSLKNLTQLQILELGDNALTGVSPRTC